MGFLNSLLGYRWSLYIVRNERELHYVMHADCVFALIEHVKYRFTDGAKPVRPWSLHLNFNKVHKAFELKPEHFTLDGKKTTELLNKQIEIDPNVYLTSWREPVFFGTSPKRRIKITDVPDIKDWQPDTSTKLLCSAKDEITFYSVMQTVFGKASLI